MKEKCCFCGAEYDTENRDEISLKTNEGSEIKVASVRFDNRRLCICAKCLIPYVYGVVFAAISGGIKTKLSQISIDNIKFEKE